MTGKEALEAFKPVIELIESLPVTNVAAKERLIKGLQENIVIIEKDLEVLEIISRHWTNWYEGDINDEERMSFVVKIFGDPETARKVRDKLFKE